MRHPVTIRIQGYVTGTLWMPATRGAVMVDATYRLHVPTAWPFSMSSAREAVEHCCARNDGDFQTSGRLTALRTAV